MCGNTAGASCTAEPGQPTVTINCDETIEEKPVSGWVLLAGGLVLASALAAVWIAVERRRGERYGVQP
jgi:hypothetical protein